MSQGSVMVLFSTIDIFLVFVGNFARISIVDCDLLVCSIVFSVWIFGIWKSCVRILSKTKMKIVIYQQVIYFRQVHVHLYPATVFKSDCIF